MMSVVYLFQVKWCQCEGFDTNDCILIKILSKMKREGANIYNLQLEEECRAFSFYW